MMQEVRKRDNYCFRPVIRLNLSVILITFTQVIKVLFQIWDAFHKSRSSSFFSGCTNLTILSLRKDQFKLDCFKQGDRFNCIHLWQNNIIAAALFTLLDVIVNVIIAFCYAVYRCRVKVKRTNRVTIKRDHGPDLDEDGFQVVELK
ncbi:hypothetical protein K501DRAFT_269777 [Backusella circina FSU 941]|nr:hypothetical protein K501DRAFT_269777 [Backusella circina FSU 941]